MVQYYVYFERHRRKHRWKIKRGQVTELFSSRQSLYGMFQVLVLVMYALC